MPSKKELIVTTNDGDMRIVVMDITPRKASDLLDKNTSNRNLRQGRVAMYASEMKNGNWKSNGVPIIIGDDGVLKDGQHRLCACVKANATMKNAVVIYLPKAQTNCYDIGATRTAVDVAKFMGIDDHPYLRSNAIFASVNLAITGRSDGYRSYSKIGLVKEIQKHPEACEFIYYKILSNGAAQNLKFRKSGFMAAIFNAFLTGYDREKLERFCTVLIHGIVRDEAEIPIIKLRDQILNISAQSRRDKLVLYFQTQAVLKAYEMNKTTVDLKKADKEYYSYPK